MPKGPSCPLRVTGLEDGKKAAATNKRLCGKDFYEQIGEAGAKIRRGGGFAGDNDFAVEMGQKGGTSPRKRMAAETD